MFLPKVFARLRQPAFIDILVSLVVVGLVLVAFFAYLNPLERMRQAEDKNTFSLAKQLADGLSSYENARGQFPWDDSQEADSPSDDNSRPRQSWLRLLEAGKFLSPELRRETNLKEYLVVHLNPRKVCFYPQSALYRQQGKYDQSGINECLPAGFTPCYICFDY